MIIDWLGTRDWSATGSMLTGLGTVASAIAIAFAARVGAEKADDFRDQKRVGREMEIAEKALAAAYQMQSALDGIRNPFSSGTELAEAKAELDKQDWYSNLTDAEKHRWDQANVFVQRIRDRDAPFEEAASILPFVRAYFGSAAEEALGRVIRARHTVRIYAEEYGEGTGTDANRAEVVRSYIWRGFSGKKPDPIRTEVEGAIETLEEALKPAIGANVALTVSESSDD